MWAYLQAHLRMREILESDFSADSKLSPILNIHLQDNTVMNTSFQSLFDKVIEVSNNVNIAKKTTDTAKTQADKALKKASG